MTQDLIKQMREQYAKQQEEKIAKEQPIEEVVINPAPTPDATNTPQDVLNRTVATIKKVNETKANANLKVQSVDGTQHDLSTMDGSVDDKLLASLKFIEGTFETQSSVATKLASKQDTLTKTITLTFDDNTTETIKVG